MLGFGAERMVEIVSSEFDEIDVYKRQVSHSGPSGGEDPGEVEPARPCGRNLYIGSETGGACHRI